MAGTGVSKPSRWLPWKGHRLKLAHDPCDGLPWGLHGPFWMAAGLDRNKRGSVSLSRPEELTTLWWITLSSEERGGCCWSRTRPALTL